MTIHAIHLSGDRQSGNTTMGLGMLAAVRALGHRAVVIYPTQRAAQWAVTHRGVPPNSALWPACVNDAMGLLAGVRAVMIDDSDIFKPGELSECLAVVKRAFECQIGPRQLIIVGPKPETLQPVAIVDHVGSSYGSGPEHSTVIVTHSANTAALTRGKTLYAKVED